MLLLLPCSTLVRIKRVSSKKKGLVLKKKGVPTYPVGGLNNSNSDDDDDKENWNNDGNNKHN